MKLNPAGPHHLVVRGNNRRKLFSCQPEYELFVLLVGQALKAADCQLHAMTLLTNHVHILVTPPTVSSLSQLVKYACQRFAQRRNKQRHGSGKLLAGALLF